MPAPDRVIRLKTVLARTDPSRSTIYRKIAEGTFPSQIRISIMAPDGGNPRSIAGSPILWRGARKTKGLETAGAGGYSA